MIKKQRNIILNYNSKIVFISWTNNGILINSTITNFRVIQNKYDNVKYYCSYKIHFNTLYLQSKFIDQ